MRLPVRRSWSRPHLWFHALAALLLAISIVAPMAVAMPVAAQRDDDPPPLPAPLRVAAVGSFQTAIGCPQDYDASCQLTELADAGGGTWSTVLPVPPGDYTLRIVASSDQDRSLGVGGDPDGNDLTVSLPESATGLYVAYDAPTGAIVTEPVEQRLEVVTDNGDRIALAPSSRGGYVAFFDSPAGTYGIQILVDEQPVGQDQISLDQPSRVVLETDQSGAITTLQTVDGTLLSVAKRDDAGTPLSGSCFAVLARDNTLQGQACDADDGEDGTTTLRFPNGLPAGSYDLNEVLTPDGQDEADGQEIDLGPGRYAAEAVVGGGGDGDTADDQPSGDTDEDGQSDAGSEEPDQPGIEPPSNELVAGRVVVRATDDAGEALPAACFVLIELGLEACDDDGDGSVVFENVAAGFYTLTETAAPEGYLANADSQIEVAAEGNRYRISHQAVDGADADDDQTDAADEPAATEEAEQPIDQPAAEGSLTVSARDAEDQPVTGACFALTPRGDEASGQPLEQCDDDDGNDDGEVAFDAIAAGQYRLDETTTPGGFQPADGQNVEVIADQTASIAVDYRAAEGEPGTLVILVVDDAQTPVGETCFSLESEAAVFENICDQGNDGRLNIPEIPTGEYAVRQVETAAGHDLAEDETVTVPAGDVAELTVENPRTGGAETPAPDEDAADTPTPGDADTGAVLVVAEDAARSPLAGGCYAVAGAAAEPVCDGGAGDADPEAGRVRLDNVPSGDYEVFETQPPAGTAPAFDAVAVSVTAGEVARARFSVAGAEA
ncbi:MAG: SpaA isopeptide-forming pilin-related protein, partial [Chloroflexota bacterium]|nr:SpaA isopeptide-forming pilin-related protein [Chloroflexota bacterium]